MRNRDSERMAVAICALGMPACILLAALGCGQEDAWRSSLGVRMLSGELQDYFTPEQVDAHASHALAGLVALGLPEAPMRRALAVERVWMFPGAFHCAAPGAPDRTCNGMQLAATLAIARTGCVWGTALQHEMIHHLLDVARHDPDADHTWHEAWELDVPLGECQGP